MANPTITFNDGAAATITLVTPRFDNWIPDRIVVDDRQVALGTGVVASFVFRTDYVASFEIPHLKPADLAIALRLKAWLISGGTCTVTTQDLGSRVYTVGLQPNTEPSIEFTDRVQVEYTMKLQVANRAAADLLCEYE